MRDHRTRAVGGGLVNHSARSSRRLIAASILLLAAVLACARVSGPEPTAVPATATQSGTRTPRPTPTKRPTATPNLAGTQRAKDFAEELRELEAAGYIETTQGEVFDIEGVNKTIDAKDFYWWVEDVIGPDFVFSAHFRWSTAEAALGVSGCGLVFGGQDGGVGYSLYLDDTRLEFVAYDGDDAVRIQPSSGDNKFDFPNPAEADFSISVRGQKVWVWVDDELTTFRLKETHGGEGTFGPAMTSATTQGYGTRCEITDAKLWLPD